MTIEALIEKLSAVEEGSRELDGLIAQAFGLMPTFARWESRDEYSMLSGESIWVSGHYGDYKFYDPEPYTASLDAAVALVEQKLPNCSWGIESEQYYDNGTIRPRYVARIRAQGSPRLHVVASFATPALALCLALLRALALKGEG